MGLTGHNRLVAVFTSLDDRGVASAQLTLREDGSLDSYGDPSAYIDALALLLHHGPRKLAELSAGMRPMEGAPA